MTVLLGLFGAYMLVGLLFWMVVMAHGGFRQPDGNEAPLVPCVIATVLMWPSAVRKLEIY